MSIISDYKMVALSLGMTVLSGTQASNAAQFELPAFTRAVVEEVVGPRLSQIGNPETRAAMASLLPEFLSQRGASVDRVGVKAEASFSSEMRLAGGPIRDRNTDTRLTVVRPSGPRNDFV